MKAKTDRRWNTLTFLTIALLVAFATIAKTPMTALASPVLGGIAVFGSGVTIGNSSKIGHPDPSSPVHSFIGGQILGETISIGNATVVGDMYAADGNLTLGNYAKAFGVCSILGGGLNLGTGASCISYDQGADDSLVDQAFIDASGIFYNFDIIVNVNCATATLGPQAVAAGKTKTIATTVAGLNLIQVDSVTLGNSSTLTLSGGPGDSILLHIMSDLTMGSGAHIRLTGGITPSQVMIFAEQNCYLGNSIGIAASVAMIGVLNAGSGAFIDGVVQTVGGATFGSNTTITNNDSDVIVPEPSPECQALNGY
jgi:hypothetical protein